MIVEGLLTTLQADGTPHLAPMGPRVDSPGTAWTRLVLRPFRTSSTYQNLLRHRAGVFHVTDDAELIARAAVGQAQPLPPLESAAAIAGYVLADACRWYELEVESVDDAAERATMVARVVHAGVKRDFLGFNRAKHAVVEAAILATRLGLVEREEILARLAQLRPPVDKTGGPAEQRAFAFLENYVRSAAAPTGIGEQPVVLSQP